MAVDTRNYRFSKLAAAVFGAVALGALAIPLTPANAQFFAGCGPAGCGFGVGGFGIGVTNPYYAPYYTPYDLPPARAYYYPY